MAPIIWRLRGGADRRFRAGHPWVYSNELASSPKGLEPGAPVELRDAQNRFLARGYGNPHSLIAFRALSRNPEVTDPGSAGPLLETLQRARHLREIAGLDRYSHRLVFGEADQLPGLIIDRYRLARAASEQAVETACLVIQAHTAGAQRLLAGVLAALESLAGATWATTAVVLRNDVGVRKLEGLEEEAPRIVRGLKGVDLGAARIEVAAASGRGGALEFGVDLVGGQKTGFFLDQFGNIAQTARLLRGLRPVSGQRLRILDLCCYVGQWGAQLARAYGEEGLQVEVTAVDASEKALASASRNIKAESGSTCRPLRADVLKDLGELASGSFDLVISDPPALIQGRKDLGPGTHAYLQLNTQVFRLVRPGGGVVSCSCSGLLEDEDLARVLTKASARNQRQAQWIGRGTPAPDHPALSEFPEGRYLKAWIGIAR